MKLDKQQWALIIIATILVAATFYFGFRQQGLIFGFGLTKDAYWDDDIEALRLVAQDKTGWKGVAVPIGVGANAYDTATQTWLTNNLYEPAQDFDEILAKYNIVPGVSKCTVQVRVSDCDFYGCEGLPDSQHIISPDTVLTGTLQLKEPRGVVGPLFSSKYFYYYQTHSCVLDTYYNTSYYDYLKDNNNPTTAEDDEFAGFGFDMIMYPVASTGIDTTPDTTTTPVVPTTTTTTTQPQQDLTPPVQLPLDDGQDIVIDGTDITTPVIVLVVMLVLIVAIGAWVLVMRNN